MSRSTPRGGKGSFMRRLTAWCPLGPRRWHSVAGPDPTFLLYGRSVEAPGARSQQKVVVVEQCSPPNTGQYNSAGCQQSAWVGALRELSAQLYAAPRSSIHQRSAEGALRALVSVLSSPHERQITCYQQFWQKALAIDNYTFDEMDISCAALVATVLFYNGKYKHVVGYINNGKWLEGCKAAVDVKGINCALRLCTLYILSASFSGIKLRTSAVEDIKRHAGNAQRVLKSRKTDETAREYKILIYALDWYTAHCCHFELVEFVQCSFDSLVPDAMRPYVFSADTSFSLDSLRRASPALLLLMGHKCATDGNSELLRRLFAEVVRREKVSDGFRFFLLSARLGDLVALTPGVDSRTQLHLTNYCGASLSCAALARIGSKSHNCPAVLRVLGGMEGPAAYFAVREILFHRGVGEVLAFQREYGDVFSGQRNLVWEAALQAMSDSLARGDVNWRDSLENVLRLLSDAGKHTVFFELLRESHNGDKETSLMIASALGQAIRRSSQWWRALDVLEMLALSNPPQNTTDDMFLQDACLQTLYALRDAKRWREALAFYVPLGSVAHPPTHRVFCSLVCGMPSLAPWQAALATAQQLGEVPEKFIKTLVCARDPDRAMCTSGEDGGTSKCDITLNTVRHMLQGFAEGGHWQHALHCVSQRREFVNDRSLWISVLRAAQRSPLGSLSGNFFGVLPDYVWESPELLRLCLLAAEAHGLIFELSCSLEKHREQAVVAEYFVLTQFLLYGKCLHSGVTFTNKYVIYRILMAPLPSAKPMAIDIMWEKGAFESCGLNRSAGVDVFVQKYFKLHPTCVPRRPQRKGENILTVRTILPHDPLQDSGTLVAVMGSTVVVAYKPPGTSTHTYARAIAQKAHAGVMYSLAYLLSPSSSGLILLLAPVIPTKSVVLEMKVFLRLCPMGPSSLPLLSTNFYSTYEMSVADASQSDVFVLTEAVCRSDSDGLLGGSLYRLRESVSSEGWGICGLDTTEAVADEALHVAELVFRRQHQVAGEEITVFRAFPGPSWTGSACVE
uniref:Uncharacterized protein n=1 Tax=Trypanosoma congolense (strain IL3000) TaxID=1068625 RepID=G0UK60_TRYCI|nr:conserved hypothetical protein [Trypanosoma congolense IL3000]